MSNTLKLENAPVNEMQRILSGGERRKYTVRVHLQDGKVIEFQEDVKPGVQFHSEDRCLWLFGGNYPQCQIMRWPEGAILLVEDNNGKPTT